MVRIKENQNSVESPRPGEVGEIDTRAPFQSVKAAVSLFGEVATKRKPAIRKTKSSSENVLDRETQLLLAQKEINGIKLQLENAEATRARALSDLEKAKRTVQELTAKLNAAVESKLHAIEATDSVRTKAKHLERVKSQTLERTSSWKKELDTTREEYKKAAVELNTAKQELTKVRQDFDATLEAKLAAFQQAAEAQRSAKSNAEKAGELSKEIQKMGESLDHLKATSLQAQKEQARISEERDARLNACKIAKEEAERKLILLKEEFDPEQTRNLELKLAETTAEIEVIQEEMKQVHASDMDSVKVVTMELNEATKALETAAEQESSYRNLVTSLKNELEDLKRERADLEERVQEVESTIKGLQAELDNDKQQLVLETTAFEQAKATDASNEESLSLAIQRTMQEAQEMSKEAEELKGEAEASRAAGEEAQRKLEEALKEAEVAKTEEKSALEQMKILSAKTDAASAPDPDSGGWIRMPMQEFENLSRKVEESANLAEMKLAAAVFQMEAVNTKKAEAENRKEAILKEIEEIKAATELALKQAEMAEAAKKAIEGELQKRRQQVQES